MVNSTLAWTNDWARPNCEGKYGATGWYRIINPLTKLGAEVEKGKYLFSRESAPEMRKRGSVWIMKPVGDPVAYAIIRSNAQVTGAKLVVDIDDDPFATDPNHPQYQYHKDHEDRMRMQLENAHHVIVSTEPLKTSLEKYNENITVIPNGIDINIWKVKPKKHKNIRIGWLGSASHLVDIPIIKDVIPHILKKYPNVEFHHAGMALFDATDKQEFAHKGTKGYEDYPQFVADLGLDIAIAPLKDTHFNRCKSNIKWLEHSMLKTPMVLSDVYPYSMSVKHGKTGYLAKTTGQWIKHLSNLIESKELRKKIGTQAYKEVVEKYNVENFLPQYQTIIDKLKYHPVTLYTALTGKYDKLSTISYNASQIAFSDQKSTVWNILPPYTKFTDQSRNSRAQKILAHLFLDCEYSIYLDANIDLLIDPEQLVKEWLKDKDIAVFKHAGRDCIYEEADAIAYYQKETPEALKEQVVAYAKRGWLEHKGLAECGVIVRRHTPEVAQMNEKWWAEYCRYSKRDQMSFPLAFPLEKVHLVEGSAHTHPYFSYRNHICT